jgi:hypothetical protein
MRIRFLLWISLLILPSVATADPVISFGESSVKAEGITKSAKVVFFSVAREGQGYRVRSVPRQEMVEDTDGDGAVSLDLGAAVPFRSIWAAVDLASGAFAVASPDGYTPVRLDFPLAGLRGQANGKPDRLDDRRYSLEVLVARPGEGAWRLSLGDGDADDEDKVSNGRIEWAVAKGRAVKGEAAAPRDFNPGDVVIAMDPNRMEFYATRLPGPKP